MSASERIRQKISFNEEEIVADGFENGSFEPRYKLLKDEGAHAPDVDVEIDQGTRACALGKSLAF